ncbi:ABC transporter permease [Metabacillus idriensis]|uniref:ABC transporter permease n=1 Tax=Metabacillus idriensis TaxID=324768 RepID=UPI003D2B3E9B
MVGGGLFEKEFKQVRTLFLFLFIFNSFALPFAIWSQYSSYMEFLKKHPTYTLEPFVIRFGEDPILFISTLFLFFIAINQMGTERAKGIMDFTLALPYKRSKIFFVKWILAIGIIVFSTLISLILSGSYIEWHDIAVSEPLLNYYFIYFSSLTMFYTLTLSAGALTGTPFAQGLTAISASVLPLLFTFVVGMNVEAFKVVSYPEMEKLYEAGYLLTPALQFFGGTFFREIASAYRFYFAIPGSMAIIFYLIGYFSFIKHPNERNGNFFLWKQLNFPVQLIVILLGVLGFSSFGYGIANESFTGYILGAIIGAAVSVILGYYLIYKKTKQS